MEEGTSYLIGMEEGTSLVCLKALYLGSLNSNDLPRHFISIYLGLPRPTKAVTRIKNNIHDYCRTEKVGDDLGGESRRRENKGTYECCAAYIAL